MQPNALNLPVAGLDVTANDLGPLAWVLDELRKSLDGAAKALKRFVKDAEAIRGSDLAALDASQLRIARQQLHQVVGAVEMLGLAGPARVLRAMESAVQKFVQQPEQCNQDAVAKIERASIALTEYLEGVLAEKPLSAVALFPQYRDVQELVRADRIHPADLWPHVWRWLEPEFTLTLEPRYYDADARATFDQLVLQLMKGKAPQAAENLQALSLGLAAGQTALQPKIFWKIAAAFFQALAHDLLPSDMYVRRAASRVLLQYASLSRGDMEVSERLTQDLLFFCSQALGAVVEAPVLTAVRSAYGLARFKPVDYETVQFGRFDPALLTQARKRIVSAKETWSSLAAGDTHKFQIVVDQFSLVSDSLLKLHPHSEPLAQALIRTIDMTARSAQTPNAELAMEVATSVLYLEAAFDDLDPNDPQLTQRAKHLAERLESVKNGGRAQPLEPWMEALYRRVSDKQTMGSVVGELRLSLGDIEKSLDIFFRNPQDKTVLTNVPGKLAQMRGVLSVLGLDEASQAVLRMRDSVEQMLETAIDEERARSAGTFDQLGNNLGALSFLIDMLNYQPALAKKLFVYDDQKGELRPLMGRTLKADGVVTTAASQSNALSQKVIAVVRDAGTGIADENLTVKLDALATHAALADQSELAKIAHDASVAVSGQNPEATASAFNSLAFTLAPAPAASTSQVDVVYFEEHDLQDIFLEEAREITVNGQVAVNLLAKDPGDINQLTVLRRVFHTLKGSARMVGLNEFGEAAWSMEQLFNSWLADQKPANDELRSLSTDSLAGFSRWIEDIAANQHSAWTASAFRVCADALRSDGQLSPLILPPASSVTTFVSAVPEAGLPLPDIVPAAQVVELADEPGDAAPDFDFFSSNQPATVSAPFEEVPQMLPDVPDMLDIQGIDFDSFSELSSVSDVAFLMAATPTAESTEIEALQKVLDSFELESSSDAEVGFETTDVVDLSAADFDAQFLTDAAPVLPEIQPAALTTGDIELELDHFDMTDAVDDEQIKVIGDLRIGIPLYNVYLNEADEWSRRLVTEVSEWAIERHHPIGDSTVSFAHSLAGSSATVGFASLSEIARALEDALQRSQVRYSEEAAAQYANLFVNAAEDIRRLLHQFAAGFLKESNADVLSQLRELDFFDALFAPLADRDDLDIPTEIPAPEFFDSVAFSLDQNNQNSHGELQSPPPKSSPPPAVILLAVKQVVPRPVVAELLFSSPAAQAFSNDQNDVDDEIDAVDAIDPELFQIFDEEASDLMPQLGGALRQWSARPDNLSARMEVLRALHTLKGSARLAGALRLGEMAHRIESEIEHLGSDAAGAHGIEPLLPRFDAMQHTLEVLRNVDSASAATSFNVASASAPAILPVLAVASAAPVGPVTEKVMVPAPQAMAMQPLRQAASASVRVRSQLLDRMVNQAGEVMMTRARLEVELNQLRGSLGDMTGNMNRLRQQLRDIELQAETQMQSRLAQAKEQQSGFDPLEFDRFTRVQELTRMMAESVNDVATVQRTLQRTVAVIEDDLIAQARQTRELQRDLLRTRMVEFEGISDRLYRVVRQASKETGKQVKLELLGGTIEMDRGMLDRMTPAFEHLLRNCVAHGIESPSVRTASGKDAAGLITVHLRQEGNDVSVEFSDDGAGLDLDRIREKALSSGLMAVGQSLDDQQAADLIFMPGFTTASKVTELAGRGIGMDVVRSEVNSVGGRIETSTAQGKGTQFKLLLPLTTAVTQVVMVRTGNLSIGVPANVVETVRRATAKELQQAYNTGTFDVAGEAVPFFWSGVLLQASHQSSQAQGKTTPVVVFRSAAQRIALHVDEVLGNQEVVVKNLGPQLSRLPGLAGMSVLASGAVVLIYNPVALAAIYGQQARSLSADNPKSHMLEASGNAITKSPMLVAVTPHIPLIMVVDDSITVRRVTQRLLQREGYRVVLAADGLQALERLQDERPAIVLSDIEMPRMDGFDLARNIRSDVRLRDLPIVMISSRIAEKHREHAKELGVDHYLGKPYAEEELMSLVRHYCGLEVPI